MNRVVSAIPEELLNDASGLRFGALTSRTRGGKRFSGVRALGSQRRYVRVFQYSAKAVLIAVAVGILNGCAGADRRYSQGLEWVVSAQQERQRLQAQGFPQYSRD